MQCKCCFAATWWLLMYECCLHCLLLLWMHVMMLCDVNDNYLGKMIGLLLVMLAIWMHESILWILQGIVFWLESCLEAVLSFSICRCLIHIFPVISMHWLAILEFAGCLLPTMAWMHMDSSKLSQVYNFVTCLECFEAMGMHWMLLGIIVFLLNFVWNLCYIVNLRLA